MGSGGSAATLASPTSTQQTNFRQWSDRVWHKEGRFSYVIATEVYSHSSVRFAAVRQASSLERRSVISALPR